MVGGQTTSRMISQLLMEMDSLKAVAADRNAHAGGAGDAAAVTSVASRVFVLAATNALSAIDPAFLQPGMTQVIASQPCSRPQSLTDWIAAVMISGRFENVLFVGLPSGNERRAILKIQKAKMPWGDNVDLGTLVDATEGANAASLVALCQAAAIHAMQRIPAGEPVANQVPKEKRTTKVSTIAQHCRDSHSSSCACCADSVLRWRTLLPRWRPGALTLELRTATMMRRRM